MSDNEIDLYGGGDLQPYSPGTDLSPILPQGDWGATDVDMLSDRAEQAFAPDVAPEMQAVFKEMGGIIAGDLLRLGHPIHLVNATLNWYAANMGRDPGTVQRRHSFDLHRYRGDGLAESFGNHCQAIGASQEYVNNCLWLLEQMAARATGGAQQQQQQQAPTTGQSAQAILDGLNDRDFAFVERHNQNVAAQTEAYLRSKWHDSYSQNLATANQYLANLPESHRAHFDQFEPGTWTLALNSASSILGLFQAAIGGNNLPTGGALATEIQQIEQLMRTNRKAYNKDLQIQARYRMLLEQRGH